MYYNSASLRSFRSLGYQAGTATKGAFRQTEGAQATFGFGAPMGLLGGKGRKVTAKARAAAVLSLIHVPFDQCGRVPLPEV